MIVVGPFQLNYSVLFPKDFNFDIVLVTNIPLTVVTG